MRKNRSHYMGTSFRDRGRIAGSGMAYDRYDDESVLDSHIRQGRPIGISEREERAKREREESPVTTYYIEKAPGDAGTSGLGADEKIQVNDNTNPNETQEIKRLVKLIGLYKEMVKLTGSGYGKMAISVDLFSGDRVQVRHEWFFDNITEYNIDPDFSPIYSSYWAEISGIIVFCLAEKDGEDV